MRILFLASSPDDESKLRLDREYRQIEERLAEASGAGRPRAGPAVSPELKVVWAVQAKDLIRKLLAFRPDVVHFAGHGSVDGLVLEDEAGRGQAVKAEILAEALSAVGGVRCVVLNACYSDAQAKAIAEVVDVVAGASPDVSDGAAMAFAAGFYHALGLGESFERAFHISRSEMKILGLQEAGAFRLHARQVPAPEPTTPPGPRPGEAGRTEDVGTAASGVSVFVSKPTALTAVQDVFWRRLRQVLTQQGLRLRLVGETDVVVESPLIDVVRVLRECHGVVVLGFAQTRARDVILKDGTAKEKPAGDLRLATPWNHMEASMAYALGLPLLVIRQDAVYPEGMFDRAALPLFVPTTDLSEGWLDGPDFRQRLGFWHGHVLDHHGKGSARAQPQNQPA